MKNALLKFAGLFVEKVPVDEHGKPLPKDARRRGAQGAQAGAPGQPRPQHPQQQQPPQPQQPQQRPAMGAPPAGYPGHAAPHQTMQSPAPQGPPMGAAVQPGGGVAAPAIGIALRAWVPEEYAAHLAPFGLHVITAGGSVTSEQARAYGAHVLVISAECLGHEVHLLTTPQLPTVFIAPQAVMIPEVAGVVQVQEPLRASEVAAAAREALAAWTATH